jgi:hypothetical protein
MDRIVSRLPNAPRLNLSGQREPDAPPAAPPEPALKPVQAQWIDAVRHMLDHADDVGERFPEEARRIRYGETQARGLRAQASAEERRALLDEGIEIMSLPLPAALKGPVQ